MIGGPGGSTNDDLPILFCGRISHNGSGKFIVPGNEKLAANPGGEDRMNNEPEPSDNIMALKMDIVALDIELMEVQKNLHDMWFVLVLIIVIGIASLLTWAVSAVVGL